MEQRLASPGTDRLLVVPVVALGMTGYAVTSRDVPTVLAMPENGTNLNSMPGDLGSSAVVKYFSIYLN